MVYIRVREYKVKVEWWTDTHDLKLDWVFIRASQGLYLRIRHDGRLFKSHAFTYPYLYIHTELRLFEIETGQI